MLLASIGMSWNDFFTSPVCALVKEEALLRAYVKIDNWVNSRRRQG